QGVEKGGGGRYATALAVAEDLARFREGKQVAARPVGAVARLARACRRRPMVALLFTLLMASLFGGLGGVTWKWLEADEQRDQANAEKQAALYQTYRARIAAAVAALSLHDVADAARQLEEAPEELRDWEWRHPHPPPRRRLVVAPFPGGAPLRLPVRPPGPPPGGAPAPRRPAPPRPGGRRPRAPAARPRPPALGQRPPDPPRPAGGGVGRGND